jgi:1,4-dihydroxy-2-naphthoate octaprenyltransferase
MFKSLLGLLEKSAFWFIFICACCLFYSVLAAVLFGSLPSSMIIIGLDLIAIVWCYFAGTLPVIYHGLAKLKQLFTHEQE